jgi:glycosyltransferase involved in cell wall biosynthesis
VRVGVYCEPSGAALGGAEYSAAVLAEALAGRHRVELVHHKPSLTAEDVTRLFDVDLSRVRLRYFPLEPGPGGRSRLPWRRYRESQAWHADVSRPYDLFINFAHGVPPFCHAPAGVLFVLFPYFDRPNSWPWSGGPAGRSPRLWRRLQRAYYDWEWDRRLAGYQVKASISHFTAEWTRRRWGVESQVLYPPVDTRFGAVAKENQVLSVGRFVPNKKQLEMVDAFRDSGELRAAGWRYVSVGPVADSPQGQQYFKAVCDRADGLPIELLVSAGRPQLKSLFETAKVFWHAKGYGEDDGADPACTEHFGISTVEAMAAGCVPVVINKGGQPEIVQHGVNGFVWDTLDELKEYTLLLARDEGLRERMSVAARERARNFSREAYVRGFLKLAAPFLR